MAEGRLRGSDLGGIVSLAIVMDDHASALDFDLMTMTGRCMREWTDIGAAGMVALVHFVRHLDARSALIAETREHGEELREWSCGLRTNSLLADLYDEIAHLLVSFARVHSKHKVHDPKKYPRPWLDDDSDERRKFGKDPIKIADFADWWTDR